MARRLMASERSDHTLQPTALVGEIYTRLCGEGIPMVLDRDHFIKLARRVMKHVLIEHGRRVALRDSILRPDGAAVRLSPALLGGFVGANSARSDALVDPDVLLGGLEELERRHAERAEAYRMQVVLGMRVQEIALALEKPHPTIQSWLRFCRSFMDVYLGRDPKGGDLHP